MSDCAHEPALTITAANPWPSEVICPCRHCGTLMSFPIADPSRPRLRVIAGGAGEAKDGGR